MDIYRLYGAMDIRREQTEKPVPKKGEALIRTAYVGMCGSDMPRVLKGEVPFFPSTIGHEFSAVVEEVGEGVTSLKKGDKVAIAPLLVCGGCKNCPEGNPGQCINAKFLGLRVPDVGGLAEYNALPAQNLVKCPDDMDLRYAAMAEPVTVALHAMNLMHFTPEKPVAIIGAGTIGMLAVQCAHAFGAKTMYVFDVDDKRLEQAKKFGATHVYNTKTEGFLEKFMEDTDGFGSPQVIEAVGIQDTILLALEIGGVMCETAIIGEVREPITIPAFNFYRRFSYRQQNLHGVYQSYTGKFPGKEFPQAIEMIHSGQIRLEELIYCVDHMDNLTERFQEAKTPGKVTGKMIFHF